MGYFNYHAKAKSLINGGHLKGYEIVENWNGIKPALVLHFDNNRSMPIREHRWDEYFLMFNGNTNQKGGACMTEKQIYHAKEFLLKLYAENLGFKNPQITINKEKGEKKDA